MFNNLKFIQNEKVCGVSQFCMNLLCDDVRTVSKLTSKADDLMA